MITSAFIMLALAMPTVGADTVDFTRDVLPVFQKHCLSCHGPTKQKGGLRLDVKAAALRGGTIHGPDIVPGKSDESPLVQFAAGLDEDLVMPPNEKNQRILTDQELKILRDWVDAGAPWPETAAAQVEDPLAHWAYRPLHLPAVPKSGRAGNPIDEFINARLDKSHLTPAPEADRRALIRRLTFDLHGLPPTPEEVETFVIDPASDAYERLVDRLLASPRLGERFARQWLDVAHFGESNGFGMDRPRRNAWPYRDYLIAAFNANTPYARFVQEQVAADALFPDEPAKIPALGLAAAGPFNQSALAEQVDGTDCKKIALNLDRDDMVSSVAATFLSLTVHCARCHDHKFDPISQVDYYRLQAVFAGVGRTEREFDADPKTAAIRQRILAERAALDKNGDALTDDPTRLATARARWEAESLARLRGWTVLNPSVIATASGTKLVRQGDGSFLATGANPATETYTLTFADVPPGTSALRLEVLPDPTLPGRGPGRADNGNLHLTEWKAALLDGGDTPRPLALVKPTADHNQPDWGIEKALDGNPATGWGIHPEEGKAHTAIVSLPNVWDLDSTAALRLVLEQQHGRNHTIGRFRISAFTGRGAATIPALPADVIAALSTPRGGRTPDQERLLARHYHQIDITARLAALPAMSRVYAIAGEFPAFRNYKPPGPAVAIRVLKRGDLKFPLDAVGPGALSCVRALPSEFKLDGTSDEKARRAAFARWLTDPVNPLTLRSIANRVWHWHFGVGLVDTPNDFGKNGGRPSHPELLDWLAATLRDDPNGSLKSLHRLIVMSDAYRRSSADTPLPDDADNRLLARARRRRLDAEQLRDALLLISGKLDSTMGGPSAMQFVFSDPNQEVSPRIDYAGFDPDSPTSLRRGVYRFLYRNVTDPLLEAFDSADPSLSTPRRNVTITPQQALSLWNSRFVLRQCEHLAARLEREAADSSARLDRACNIAWGRPPTADERDLLADHATRHGLASACRIVLNANDFLFIP
jgi:mono/diheme cytochrome c family protein